MPVLYTLYKYIILHLLRIYPTGVESTTSHFCRLFEVLINNYAIRVPTYIIYIHTRANTYYNIYVLIFFLLFFFPFYIHHLVPTCSVINYETNGRLYL